MDRDSTRLADLSVAPRSRQVIEASIAAGTGGIGFVILQAILTTLAIVMLLASLGIAALSAASALAGEAAAWRSTGFALLFALPIAVFLPIQISFLVRLRRGA